jgi:lysophospholipase L1-like esterase
LRGRVDAGAEFKDIPSSFPAGSMFRFAALLFVTFCLPLAVIADECPSADMILATTPSAPYSVRAIEQYQSAMANMPDSADMVLLGDSILGGWPRADYERDFPGKQVFNFSVGNDRVQNVLWRLQSGTLAEISPREVVVLIGTNNLGNTKPCAVIAGFRDILAKVDQLWPAASLSVFGILPRGHDFNDYDKDRLEINAAIRQMAADGGSRFLDVDDRISCGLYGKVSDPFPFNILPWRGPPRCNSYKDDELHIVDLGYQRLSEALR